MAKIPRVTQPIFAASAANNGQFGSAQAGTKVLSNDLATLMALSAFAQGWLDALIGGSKFPPLEEFQALTYIQTTQLAYLFQEGIPEYDSGTNYWLNSIVKKSGTMQLFGSLTNANQGNALPAGTGSNSNWKFLLDLGSAASQFYAGGTSTGAANAQVVATANANFTLTAGNTLTWKSGYNNTGATTLAIDGTGATTVKKRQTTGLVDLAANDLVANEEYMATFDGTYFQIIGPAANPAAFLQVINNLSDLANISTAAATIGVVGVGQTWQDVSGSRSLGSNYTNSTGRPIQVSIALSSPGGSSSINANALVNSVIVGNFGAASASFSFGVSSFIVPAGAVYAVNVVSGSPTIGCWSELR